MPQRALSVLALTLVLGACGAAVDNTETLTRLKNAVHAEIASPAVLEDHNQLVRRVSEGDMLRGMRQSEVEERIGRGEECGMRPLCSEHGFRPSDWVYDVGRQPGDPDLAAGPTFIVGFDHTGFVENTYFVTRN